MKDKIYSWDRYTQTVGEWLCLGQRNGGECNSTWTGAFWFIYNKGGFKASRGKC